MELKREIGLVGLTFVGVSGVIGSGWLFIPLQAAQIAGPAAVVSWAIGSLAMLLLALTFAEISAMLPVAGGLGRLPQFSHGKTVAMVTGWSAWVGYNTIAPFEVEATLHYLGPHFPRLQGSGPGDLSPIGTAIALGLLVLYTVLNFYGVKFFARINTGLTWIKIVVPVTVVVVLLATSFEPANFTAAGGFAPYGVAGIFSAVSAGGVAACCIGFRHTIDLAGETRNPGFTVPAALLLSVLICFLIYSGLQIAFIGALRPADLAQGWAELSLPGTFGAIGAVAAGAGVLWLARVVNLGALAGPFGCAFVSVGSNARLTYALGENGFFPSGIATLSSRGVPAASLLLNLAVSLGMYLVMPFEEMLQICGAAVTLSFAVGPVALLGLRRIDPHRHRPFRVPAAEFVAVAAFAIATLIIYWGGWSTVWRLGASLLVGLVLFSARATKDGLRGLDLAQAWWLLPYCAGIGLASYCGSYGGLGLVPRGIDTPIVVVFSILILIAAARRPVSRETYEHYLKADAAAIASGTVGGR